MEKKDGVKVAKEQHSRMEMMIREREVWVRLSPVLMKWEGKKINRSIQTMAQEVLQEYRVWYEAPDGVFGRGALHVSEGFSRTDATQLKMDIGLGSKKDMDCFQFAVNITERNRWYNELILEAIEKTRRGIPLITGLCHQWNKLCDDLEAINTTADNLRVPGFIIRG